MRLERASALRKPVEEYGRESSWIAGGPTHSGAVSEEFVTDPFLEGIVERSAGSESAVRASRER